MPKFEHLLNNRPFAGRPNLAIVHAWCEDESGGKPFFLRDVTEGTGLPNYVCSNQLSRLHDKGLLDRWKVPWTQHLTHWCGKPNPMTKMVFCYQWAGAQD